MGSKEVNERSMATRHEQQDAREKKISMYFLVCKRKHYRTMTSGWKGAPYFRNYGREPVSKPAIPSKKNWGGNRRTTPWGIFHPVRSSFTFLRISFCKSVIGRRLNKLPN